MQAPLDQFHTHIVAELFASFLFESMEMRYSPPTDEPPAPIGEKTKALTSC